MGRHFTQHVYSAKLDFQLWPFGLTQRRRLPLQADPTGLQRSILSSGPIREFRILKKRKTKNAQPSTMRALTALGYSIYHPLLAVTNNAPSAIIQRLNPFLNEYCVLNPAWHQHKQLASSASAFFLCHSGCGIFNGIVMYMRSGGNGQAVDKCPNQ